MLDHGPRLDKVEAYKDNRFGKLLVYNTLSVSKDGQHWQLLDCYLFSNMLICVKEKQSADGSGSGKYSLKGSVMIQVCLKAEPLRNESILTPCY